MIKTMTANQKMAELFQRNKSIISRYIFYVFESRKLKQDPCTARFAIWQFLLPRRKRLLRSGARQPAGEDIAQCFLRKIQRSHPD